MQHPWWAVCLNTVMRCLKQTCQLRACFWASPTILAVAGSTLEETALLASRRPLLGLLVGMGSPAVAILRTFQHRDVIGKLENRDVKRGLSINADAPMHRSLIILGEYSLAVAAIANCILTSFDLSIKGVVAWSKEDWWNPLRWSVLPVVVHLVGVWSSWLDVEMVRSHGGGEKTIRQHLQTWAKDEFRPCASHDPTTFRYRPTTYGFLIVSWWAAILTLAHYIYGTAVFSAELFVATPRAVLILCRYLASTLCCRMIVAFELAGMRRAAPQRRSGQLPSPEAPEEEQPKLKHLPK
ncbi:hypothetical protein K491DRAFT_88870 [Lophiostoma macrostomum CBS 122681]|uniref:Uncharacterized protein n=1 Tax=Lophiostoma macrostomum CBS 122681 TaxID=1314788 RepID=A0A6A6SWZ2_9PLEO|nr:hypothetical protein K491DRAFT_88870 [Lophiostoma macrostomum CBS 122681]